MNPNPDDVLVELRNLTFGYGERIVLDDVSLRVSRGKVTALMSWAQSLPATDPYRMIVNLDYGSTLHPPKPSLRSEPADFQRGEVEIDGRNLYYDEWEWDVQLQWHPQE